jgi:enediyne biosynthesis protein E4
MFDYQNDGKIDMFISQWFKDYANNTMMPAILVKGNGDGSFTDVSKQTGINTNDFPLYGVNATDWNNDGWIDIATCPYCRNKGSLWKNNGDGTFTDVATQAGYNTQQYNGDGWGDGTMTYPKALCTWAAQPQDFDNDGDIDFFFVQVHGGFGNDVYGKPAGRSSIVVNQGKDSNYKLSMDLTRLDRKFPRSTHLGDYDASWFDLDNDMLQDVVMGNGSYSTNTRLYIIQQQKDHSFDDISKLLNIGNVQTMIQEVYSMEVLDYDLDGDDDILITHGDGSTGPKNNLMLIENKIGQNNKWTGILLNAPANVNGSSIGARIIVYSGGIAQMKEIKAGFGHFGGQQPFITNFGLAKNTMVDSVIVRWPSNPLKYTKVTNININKINIIDENGLAGTLNILKNFPLADFRLYPNPATNYINIEFPAGFGNKGFYRILDISGKLTGNGNFITDQFRNFSLDLNGMKQGYYLISFQSDKGLLKVLPFMIK